MHGWSRYCLRHRCVIERLSQRVKATCLMQRHPSTLCPYCPVLMDDSGLCVSAADDASTCVNEARLTDDHCTRSLPLEAQNRVRGAGCMPIPSESFTMARRHQHARTPLLSDRGSSIANGELIYCVPMSLPFRP